MIAGLWLLLGCVEQIPDVTVINDFETDQDLDRIHWECHRLFSLSGDHASHGGRCLKMELFPGLYPGVALKLRHGDWRRYCALAFDVYNDQDVTLTLTVRIDDREDYPDYKDRYNQRFALNPGINYIRIPMDTLQTSGDGRKLDVSHIQRFLLFLHRTERRYELYLDWVRLESERPGAGL